MVTDNSHCNCQDNEDKLDNVGGELKKMAQYRAQLDREREERLRGGEERSRQRKREQVLYC